MCSKLKTIMPKYVERLQLIAGDPVASVDFFHIIIDAVLKTLLRFGAKGGDGGVLGRIKAYVGMTEEQRRLTLHCHLLVWVFGFNDFASLRAFMDKTPGSYQELALFLSRTIFSRIASAEGVRHTMQGAPEPAPTDAADSPLIPRDPLERAVKECIAVPPPRSCFPPPTVERDVANEEQYLEHFRSDLADITKTANVHACTFTCHKHGHPDSCRYDYVYTPRFVLISCNIHIRTTAY